MLAERERILPTGWSAKRLGKFIAESKERAGEGHSLSVLSVTKHRGIVGSEEFFKKAVHSRDTSKYKVVRREQFAYATIHLNEGSIGKLGNRTLGVVSPMYTVFDVNAEVDSDYLLAVLKSQQSLRVYEGITQGTVRRRGGISFRMLSDLVLHHPPLAEQRKIAAILSSVDDAIEKTQAIVDQVQIVKRGLTQELLSRGLPGRHARFKQTEIGKIPEKWAIVRIIDVADVDYGISAAVSANTDPSIGWPILTGANLTLDGKIDLFKLVYHEPPSKERFHLRQNDLLLNWRSGSPKHVGKTALFDLEGRYTYASFVLRIRSRGKLVPGFGHVLLNFMRDAEFFSKDVSSASQLQDERGGISRDSDQTTVSPMSRRRSPRTAARFESRVASEAQSLAALQNVKSALMSVLLTGELRVTPDPEPA